MVTSPLPSGVLAGAHRGGEVYRYAYSAASGGSHGDAELRRKMRPRALGETLTNAPGDAGPAL